MRRHLQPRTGRIVPFDHRDKLLRRAVMHVRHQRRLRRDQEDVVQPRTAEGRHKEVVAQRVLLREIPQAQRLGGIPVVPHHQTAGVGPCGELVVAPGVDLHLVLIEAMPQIARDHAVRQRRALRIGDAERPVVQIDNIVLAESCSACRPLPAPAARGRPRFSATAAAASCRRGRVARSARRGTASSGCCTPGKLPYRLAKLRFSA